MASEDTLTELFLLVRSRYGLIVLETGEEDRAEETLRELAARLSIPLLIWTATKGLRRTGPSGAAIDDTIDPSKALEQIERSNREGIYLFPRFGTVARRSQRHRASEGRGHSIFSDCRRN
jgi:hypothetical protein